MLPRSTELIQSRDPINNPTQGLSLDEVIVALAAAKPAIQTILNKIGPNQDLQSYISRISNSVQAGPSDAAVAALDSALSGLYPDELRIKVKADIQRLPVINTAHHTAPLFPEDAFHAAVIGALAMQEQSRNSFVILSTSLIPGDNRDFPGGFSYGGISKTYIPKKHQTAAVAMLRGFSRDDMVRNAQDFVIYYGMRRFWEEARKSDVADDQVKKYEKGIQSVIKGATMSIKGLDPNFRTILEEKELVETLVEIGQSSNQLSELLKSSINSLPNEVFVKDGVPLSLADQTCLLNHHLWKQAQFVNINMPELVQLSLETVSAHLLRSDFNNQGLISSLILDPVSLKSLIDSFCGIDQAWNFKNNEEYLLLQSQKQARGTHLFLGLLSTGERIPLRLDPTHKSEGMGLLGVGKDGTEYRIELTHDEVISRTDWLASRNPELKEGYLYLAPSIALSLSACLVNGLQCIGGYSQAEYLAQMRQKLIFLSDGFEQAQQTLMNMDPELMTYGIHFGYKRSGAGFSPPSILDGELQPDLQQPLAVALATGSLGIVRDYPQSLWTQAGVNNDTLRKLELLTVDKILQLSQQSSPGELDERMNGLGEVGIQA